MPKILADIVDRKHKRFDYRRAGFIFCGAESPLYECFIIDISEGGACIEVGELIPPQSFILLLTPTGSVNRHCITAWRRGAEIGVSFLRPRRRTGAQASSSGAAPTTAAKPTQKTTERTTQVILQV
jgi:PilZ domain-containing protein